MKATAAARGNFLRGLMLSLQLLAAHRLRTALSVAGLLIGVAAVMVMAAIGRGAEQQLRTRLQTMGTDLLVIAAAPAARITGRPRQVNVQTDLSAEDAIAIVKESPAAIASAPAVNRNAVLRWEGLNRATGLSGTTPEGLRIRNIRAASGRVFDNNDDREQQRVAVIYMRRKDLILEIPSREIDPLYEFDDSLCLGDIPRPVVLDPRGSRLRACSRFRLA